MEMTFDVSLMLNRKVLGLGDGPLTASDIFTGEALDITRPVPMPDVRFGRLIWVR
jgi:hypothetical protein